MESKLEQRYQTTIEKVAFNVWISKEAKEFIINHTTIIRLELESIDYIKACLMMDADSYIEDINVIEKLEEQGVDFIYFN